MDKSLHVTLVCGFKKIAGSVNIRCENFILFIERQGSSGMDDNINPFHGIKDFFSVPNISFHKVN